jgi:hypothetical protein
MERSGQYRQMVLVQTAPPAAPRAAAQGAPAAVTPPSAPSTTAAS